MSIEGKIYFLPYIFQVLYVLCFNRPRSQVSHDHWSSGLINAYGINVPKVGKGKLIVLVFSFFKPLLIV